MDFHWDNDEEERLSEGPYRTGESLATARVVQDPNNFHGSQQYHDIAENFYRTEGTYDVSAGSHLAMVPGYAATDTTRAPSDPHVPFPKLTEILSNVVPLTFGDDYYIANQFHMAHNHGIVPDGGMFPMDVDITEAPLDRPLPLPTPLKQHVSQRLINSLGTTYVCKHFSGLDGVVFRCGHSRNVAIHGGLLPNPRSGSLRSQKREQRKYRPYDIPIPKLSRFNEPGPPAESSGAYL